MQVRGEQNLRFDSVHEGALKMAALWKPCHVKKKHVHVGGDWDNTGVWSESESPDVELEMYKVLVCANNQCAVEKKCSVVSIGKCRTKKGKDRNKIPRGVWGAASCVAW